MKIIRTLIFIVHIVVVLILVATALNAYIPPSFTSLLSLLALGFPVLLIIHVLLTLFWIISWKKRAFLFLLASILMYPMANRWLTWNKQAEGNLKLITFNVKAGDYGIENINRYLKSQNADVIFLQETGDNNFLADDYHVKKTSIVTILSKNPIESSGTIDIPGIGQSLYADIKIDGKTIRFINGYLEPFQIDKSMVRPTGDTEANQEKAKYLIRYMIPTFKKHENQVDILKNYVEASPHPVIVGGDFNSVPNSWEYYHVSKGLNDPFTIAGKGLGTSFHSFKFPIRIDYVFSSKDLKPTSYQVDRKVMLSDHFPVVTEFKIP